MMNKNLNFYHENKDRLVKQYDSVSFESVHQDWLKFLPTSGTILDIGAGSGRDARYMAEKGLQVYAAEPVLSLLMAAKENSTGFDITWFQDELPELNESKLLCIKFDLILLSAVWMHLSPEDRVSSMRNISSLLQNGGKFVITLRHGHFTDGREAHTVNADEVERLAIENCLKVILRTNIRQDQLGRGDVVWQTIVLEKYSVDKEHRS